MTKNPRVSGNTLGDSALLGMVQLLTELLLRALPQYQNRTGKAFKANQRDKTITFMSPQKTCSPPNDTLKKVNFKRKSIETAG